MNDTTARTPYCHKIRYGITGAPILTEDEMDGSYAPGVGVAPTLIELVYHAARDGKPASVSASVTGWWTRFGVREQPEDQVTVHLKNGPDGWPAWLAVEARLHGPAAAAVPVPAADQATLRDRIRRAVCEAEGFAWDSDMLEPDEYGDVADMVLGVLPAPADRATVLREVLAALDAELSEFFQQWPEEPKNSPWALGWKDSTEVVRRLAVEAAAGRVAADTPPTETQRVKHSGPNPKFCVLCLSGEHERVDDEQPGLVAPAQPGKEAKA